MINSDISDIEAVPPPYRQSHVRASLAEHNSVLLLGLSVIPVLALSILFVPFFSIILKEVVLSTLAMLVVILLSILFTAERRALRKYIQAAQKEQEPYQNTYIALSASQNASATESLSSNKPAHAQQEVQKVLEEQDRHLLLLGVPGAGKTVALRVHQYYALKDHSKITHGTSKIPFFIPMKDYNAFLRDNVSVEQLETDFVSAVPIEQTPLIQYLAQGSLLGTQDIRLYVKRWMQQGQLLLLCDGLNEINTLYLPFVCTELLRLMRESSNRLIMTCRGLDFNDQQVFHQLVDEEFACMETLQPLNPEQIREFVSKFIDESTANGKPHLYTAGQINDLIKNTRLQYECTNPLMLTILIETLNSTDLETGKQIDTRGKLWQAAVNNWIREELDHDRWKNAPFRDDDVVILLKQVAYIARRRSKDSRNALPLGKAVASSGIKKKYTSKDWAFELDRLLADPRGMGSTISAQEQLFMQSFPHSTLWKLLEFTRQAGLIIISSDNLLSFRHELLAEYFVAEYLNSAFPKNLRQVNLSSGVEMILVELIKHIGDWKEPVGIWAGLLKNPLDLADRLALLGLNYPDYGFNALTLSLLCLGIKLGTVEEQARTEYKLTENIKMLFNKHVDNKKNRSSLAQTINECAQEGGVGVYRAFLPLLRVPHIDILILLLDRNIVPELLFKHLVEIIEKNTQIPDLPAVIDILGKFGTASTPLAIKASQPNTSGYTLLPNKRTRVRQAAIEILGLTYNPAAVGPLITYLSDSSEIREAARRALIRLGPEHTLPIVLKELTRHTPIQLIEQIHYAILTILAEFLKGQGQQVLSTTDYRTIIQALLPVLSSAYTEKIQKFAEVLLLREAEANIEQRDWIIQRLILQLSSTDSRVELHLKEILRQIGSEATALLLRYLKHLSLETEIRCERIVEVLGMTHDPNAVPDLIGLIVTPYPNLRKQVAKALSNCRPASISKLIDVVLHKSQAEAEEAKKILEEIRQDCVVEVCGALPSFVSGRTQLLIQVLAHIHDARAIPHLIDLLKTALHNEELAVPIIHVLSEFSDQSVITSLLEVLAQAQTIIYDEATAGLSRLGEIALDPLIAALDVKQETPAARGIREALIHIRIDPFPSFRLLEAITQASREQEQQLMAVFLAKGAAVAPFLVDCLCISQERERTFVHQVLDLMDLRDSIPALLHGVDSVDCRSEVARYLHKYRQPTTSLLVEQLAHRQYGIGSAQTLMEFGPEVIPFLLPGLNHENEQARNLAQQVIINIANEHPEILPEVILLFRTLQLPEEHRAYESLISLLAGQLASLSIPYLLDGLSSEYDAVKAGARETIIHLVGQDNEYSTLALNGLITSLQYVDDRRDEAAEALIQIGDRAISGVNALITDNNPAVGKKSRYILSKLPGVLLTIYNDLIDSTRETAVLEILRGMKTTDIKDPLITMLTSDDIQKVKAAVTLLLIRIYADIYTQGTDKNLLPSLLDHMWQHGRRNDIMRIITFLLLLPHDLLLSRLRQLLYDQPVSQEWLLPLFLLLDMRGKDAKRILVEALGNPRISTGLSAQIMGLIGMIDDSRDSYAARWAASINQLPQQGGQVSQEQLAIAQRALGGLLVSGRWNGNKLQELLHQELLQMAIIQSEESERHELYSILLGKSYVPRIIYLRNQLSSAQAEIATHRQNITALQATITRKEEELEQVNNKLERAQSKKAELQTENYRLSGINSRLEQEKRQAEERANDAIRQREAVYRQMEFYQSRYPHRIP